MTTEDINKYIDRSKLPAVKNRYEMMGGTMLELINHTDSEEKRVGRFDALFAVIGLAYKYGMAAGYRMGKRW